MKVSTRAVDTLLTRVQNETKEASEKKVEEEEKWGFLREMLLEGTHGETSSVKNNDAVEQDGLEEHESGHGDENDGGGKSWDDETSDYGKHHGSLDDEKKEDNETDELHDTDEEEEDGDEPADPIRHRAMAMEKVLDRWATGAAIRRSNNATASLSGYNSDAGVYINDESVSSTMAVSDSRKAHGASRTVDLGVLCQKFRSMQNMLLGGNEQSSRFGHKKAAGMTKTTLPSTTPGKATVATRVQLAESVAKFQNAVAVRDAVVAISLREPPKKKESTTLARTLETTCSPDGSSTSPLEASLVASEDVRSGAPGVSGNSELHVDAAMDGLTLSSVLPRGYGLPHAVSSTSLNRRRAFLLLDLGAVVRSHRTFHSFTAGAGVYNPNRSHEEMSHAAEIKWALPSARTPTLDKHDLSTRPSVGVYIAPQFEVKKNRDIELLRLLTRLRVGLRCGSSDDIAAARQAISKEKAANARGGEDSSESCEEEKKERDDELECMPCEEGRNDVEDEEGDAIMFDDVGRTRKPDGFFRRFLFASKKSEEGGFESDAKRCEFAVDSDVEVKRIGNTIRRLAARRKSNPRLSCGPTKYILRLPRMDCNHRETKSSWRSLVKQVQKACNEEAALLVGVSVDLTGWHAAVEGEDYGDSTGTTTRDEILQCVCQDLRDVRLCFLAAGQKDMRVDMTGLPYPLTRERARSLTTALALILSRPVSALELHMSAGVSSHLVDVMTSRVTYTADMSDHLVAHAGALCTRIIGVKRVGGGGVAEKKPANVSRPQQALNNVVAKDASEKDGDKASGAATVNHYYIDDGCYGSLSCTGASTEMSDNTTRHSRGFHPVPLYGNLTSMMANSVPALSSSPSFAFTSRTPGMALPAADCVNATVWGPTCDGLDRVCESVKLPSDLKASRDWLVFPQLGCGGFGGGLGLGTAFNGFDPPDTVYCVLGYFSGGSDGFGA